MQEEQTPPDESRRVLYIIFLINPVKVKKIPIHLHNSLNVLVVVVLPPEGGNVSALVAKETSIVGNSPIRMITPFLGSFPD